MKSMYENIIYLYNAAEAVTWCKMNNKNDGIKDGGKDFSFLIRYKNDYPWEMSSGAAPVPEILFSPQLIKNTLREDHRCRLAHIIII